MADLEADGLTSAAHIHASARRELASSEGRQHQGLAGQELLEQQAPAQRTVGQRPADIRRIRPAAPGRAWPADGGSRPARTMVCSTSRTCLNSGSRPGLKTMPIIGIELDHRTHDILTAQDRRLELDLLVAGEEIRDRLGQEAVGQSLDRGDPNLGRAARLAGRRSAISPGRDPDSVLRIWVMTISPAAVRRTPRGRRSNSATPISCSKSCSRRFSADEAMPSRSGGATDRTRAGDHVDQPQVTRVVHAGLYALGAGRCPTRRPRWRGTDLA